MFQRVPYVSYNTDAATLGAGPEGVVTLGRDRCGGPHALGRPHPPKGPQCGNHRATIGALQEIRRRGAAVEVVGFDDFERSRFLPRSVTLINFDAGQLGAAAAKSMFARIEGGSDEPTWTFLLTHSASRGSVAAARATSPRPAQRLRAVDVTSSPDTNTAVLRESVWGCRSEVEGVADGAAIDLPHRAWWQGSSLAGGDLYATSTLPLNHPRAAAGARRRRVRSRLTHPGPPELIPAIYGSRLNMTSRRIYQRIQR